MVDVLCIFRHAWEYSRSTAGLRRCTRCGLAQERYTESGKVLTNPYDMVWETVYRQAWKSLGEMPVDEWKNHAPHVAGPRVLSKMCAALEYPALILCMFVFTAVFGFGWLIAALIYAGGRENAGKVAFIVWFLLFVGSKLFEKKSWTRG